MDLPVGNFNAWGSTNRGPRTEWSVTTPHDRPVPADKEKAPQAFSPDGDNLTKVVVLGAPGSGKTSIIQQFVWGTFENSYYPTSRKETYYPTVILHDKNYPLKIVDIPDIPFFPVNSFYNLSDLQAYGLRDASAYVLVYDLLCPDSFDYISGLFNQISESRRDLTAIPVLVVGNKTDKVHQNLRRKNPRDGKRDRDRDGSSSSDVNSDFGGDEDHRYNAFHDLHHGVHGHHGVSHHRGFGDFGHGGFGSHGGHRSHHKKSSSSSHSKHRSSSRHSSSSKHKSSSSSRNRKSTRLTDHSFDTVHWRSDDFLERDIADKVQGEWKVLYRECSARSAESVTDVFKALMENLVEVTLPNRDGLRGHGDDDEHRRCVIL